MIEVLQKQRDVGRAIEACLVYAYDSYEKRAAVNRWYRATVQVADEAYSLWCLGHNLAVAGYMAAVRK